MELFEDLLRHYLFEVRAYPKDLQYDISGIDMLDLIVRVDKRKVYYWCFHDGMEIDELKVAALCAYWILKLKPIRITDSRYANRKEYCDSNELFAIYIIILNLSMTGRLNRLPQGDEPFFKELRYSFRFRNFTLDALVMLVESLNTRSFFP
jgi:hypothetical protein